MAVALLMFLLADCSPHDPAGRNLGSLTGAGLDAASMDAALDSISNDAQGDVVPTAEAGEPAIPRWKFVVVGDSRTPNILDIDGVNDDVWGSLVEQIISEAPDFVLFPGDLTLSGLCFQLKHWISITQPLYEAGIGVYAVRGNHDAALNPWDWKKAFRGKYALPDNGPTGEENLTYSFTHKNVLVAAIDNYVGCGKVNQPWLDSVLAANTQPHVFAFGHEPAFAANHEDTLDDKPDKRNEFWDSLRDAGARVYFCGHDHFYDRARIDDDDGDHDNDLHQIIVGTAGAPLYAFDGNYVGDNHPFTPVQQHFSDYFGYTVVEVDGSNITMTFLRSDGGAYEPNDSFSYTVPAP